MNKIRRFFSLACVLLISVVSASASVISFQIIQHDQSQDEVRESSYIIENALFDNFFDYGYIATNNPTVTTSGPEDDMKWFSRAFMDARTGKCNYFVILTIDYNVKVSKNPKGSILSNIDSVSWELYDTSTSAKIGSGVRKVGTIAPQKNNEKGIKSFAAEIARDIYDIL